MTTTQPFKHFRRQEKIHLSEENFQQGMYYTNAPLPPEFIRLLINYDIKDHGEKITPRPGIQVYKSEELDTVIDANMIASGRMCWYEDGQPYEQIILTDTDNLSSLSSKLYEGPLWTATGPVIEELSNSTFVKPSQAKIHGMEISEVSSISRHVGTFAYGDNYFYISPGQGLKHTKFDTNKYVEESVDPKSVNPKEAVLWGYNMLRENPYHFENSHFEGSVQILGVLPYDPDNPEELLMSPKVNDDVLFKCFYEGDESKTYEVIWEWREPTSSNWNDIKKEEIDLDGLPEISASFSPPTREGIIRVTFIDTAEEFPAQVMSVGFDFAKERHGTTANIDVKNYDLTKATGMAYWNHAKTLVLYGLEDAPNMLFRSEINSPNYFPYPMNAEIFDEPIIYVVPFLDELLIFTATQLHLMSWLNEGFTTTKNIQGGLYIEPWDVHLITVVRNMVFFKSGNYYYMVVPRRGSTTGELTIAPVYKNVEFLLDNFKSSVKDILKTMYQFEEELELVHYYNYLDFEDVHNVYVFKVNDFYLNVALLYNTVDRTWRVQIYESPNIYLPFTQDATKKGTLVCLNSTAIHHLFYNTQSVEDNYDEGPNKFLNYQFLDTGHRHHNPDFKKRYQEVQFRINKISEETLKFHSQFSIDDRIRKFLYQYNTSHNQDPEDPNYGLLTVVEELVDPEVLPNITKLADTEEDLGFWELDFSIFPDTSYWKVRISVSGKGYAPKLLLLSKNQYLYELLNTSWVFRTLFAR